LKANAAGSSADGDEDVGEARTSWLHLGARHVRRGLNRVRVPKVAGQAAQLGGHGWRKISSAVSSANTGGRFTRPASALWARVARRKSERSALTGDHPHARRNRRLAFDVAVVAAALAVVLTLHHQFRRSPRPRIADAFVAASNVGPEQTVQDSQSPPHRPHRRVHKSAKPVSDLDSPPGDSHSADPALPPIHKEIVRREPPVADVHPTTGSIDSQAHDPKQTADAALDSLLSAPVASGPPNRIAAAAPAAQTEPLPPTDFDKPARPPRSSDPLLADSRDPSPAALPQKRDIEPRRDSTAKAPPVDEFESPGGKPLKHHDEEHHEPTDHGPKAASPKDDFEVPAPALDPPADAHAPKDDPHAHKHHHPDHGAGDQPPANDLAVPPAKDADMAAPKLDAPLPASVPSKPTKPIDSPRPSDPLLDVGPSLDGPAKERDEKSPRHKSDRPDDGLPVLSVPSPHKSDAKLADDGKSGGPKIDDLGPPTRTANAADAGPGSLSDSGPSKSPPAKLPENKPPAGNDSSLDDLLNSKVSSGPAPKTGSPSAVTEAKPLGAPLSDAPKASPAPPEKDDPFRTDSGPASKVNAGPKVDAPKLDPAPKSDPLPKIEPATKIEPAPKQAEPAPVDAGPPLARATAQPLHASEEDSLSSVAVAHQQIEKDEAGASLHYKIVVRNNGKKAIKVFEVDDAVPADHTVQVTDPPAETQAQGLHWTLHDMAPGEARTIVVTLAPPARPAEREPEHHPAVAEPTIVPQAIPSAAQAHDAGKVEEPRLKLELLTPIEVHAGESCRIGFRATNLGDKAADLKLNLDLPQQLHYVRGQQLQYKIGALGDHESREDYLTATATGSGQVELRAELVHAGHPIATAKGVCRVSPPGSPHRAIQQTGGWQPTSGVSPATANGTDCQCGP
jgi:hypothetical protein